VDEGGKKASKSRGNVLDPNYLFDKFGADAVRFFFCTSTVGENIRTSETYLQEQTRQFFLPLWNVYSFFVTYANIDGFAPQRDAPVPLSDRPVLDRWLLSRLSRLVEQVDGALDRYDVNGGARPIQSFVEDLSNWYVRRSRRRFWKSESDSDKLAAYQTLYETLVTLVRLMAPFTPFLAEAIHRNLCRGDSVHLADFPTADPAARDSALEAEMALAREDVAAGLAARDRARLKVRQPLRSVTVPHEFQPKVSAIIREELNVKTVLTGSEFSLDTEVTEALRIEGMARDAVRCVQDRRKRSGLNIEDRIELFYEASGDWRQVFERFGDYIAAETLALEIRPERPEGLEGAACEEGLWIGLRRVS